PPLTNRRPTKKTSTTVDQKKKEIFFTATHTPTEYPPKKQLPKKPQNAEMTLQNTAAITYTPSSHQNHGHNPSNNKAWN
ncbi:hypothetical protein ACQWHW_25280, partial [Salmonella enterica subsp. enterica serovar Infantis]